MGDSLSHLDYLFLGIEEMKCTSLRVAGAINNIFVALQASSMIADENISTRKIPLLKKTHLFLPEQRLQRH